MFDEYQIEDFKRALAQFKELDLHLDYDAIMVLVTKLIGEELIEDLRKVSFEDAILAAFANGLVLGALVAENEYKPKKKLPPLIEH